DRLRRFQVNPLKIFLVQDNELPFLVFVAFHDLIPRHFLAVLFRDPFVIYGAQIALAEKTKFQILAPRRRIKGNRDVNESEADTAFPNRTHLIKNSQRSGRLRGLAWRVRGNDSPAARSALSYRAVRPLR